MLDVGYRALRVWERNWVVWLKYYKASLAGNLGEPLLFLLAMGYGLSSFIPQIEGMGYLQFLAPGILMSAAMNSASYECTFGSFTRMTTQRTYDAIVVTPVSMNEIVTGDILWGMTKSVISSVLILLLMPFFGLVKTPLILLNIPLAILVGVMFAAMATMVTALSPSYEFFSYYFTFIVGPMFLFSGVFFPLSVMPSWMATFAWFLPLTHAVDMSRNLFIGKLTISMLYDFLWMAIFTAGIFYVSLLMVRRRLIK